MQHTPSLTTILLMNDCGMHFMRKMHLEMAFIVIFCPILIEDYNVILWGELHTLKRWRADDALSLMNGLLKKTKNCTLHTDSGTTMELCGPQPNKDPCSQPACQW